MLGGRWPLALAGLRGWLDDRLSFSARCCATVLQRPQIVHAWLRIDHCAGHRSCSHFTEARPSSVIIAMMAGSAAGPADRALCSRAGPVTSAAASVATRLLRWSAAHADNSRRRVPPVLPPGHPSRLASAGPGLTWAPGRG